MYEEVAACRSCGASRLQPVISLGETPLADRLLSADDLHGPEPVAPLDVVFCPECSLVQLTVSVSPKVLFNADYPYFSSVSPSLVEHFRDSARAIISRRGLGAGSCVVEAASNDGCMLRNFADKGIPVLGIDPSEGPVRAAREAGIPTLQDFFTETLARKLIEKNGRRADVFLANNVLAHVPDPNGFVEGIAVLLEREGEAVIEVPYVVDLVERLEFDTIYHQHHCYFSVRAVDLLFRRHGLFLNDVQRIPVHGGSLRIFAGRHDSPSPKVADLLSEERAAGADSIGYFESFSGRVQNLQNDLVSLLRSLKSEGKRIAAYGAAAKATTLLSTCGIDGRLIDYIVDRNPVKHGRLMGGCHLEIFPVERVLEDRPDYLLLLAWNFASEIISTQRSFREAGGRFIVPIPGPKVI